MGMPWSIRTTMSQRHEFVLLAVQPDANVRQLCRRFGISAKTGYKWIERYNESGVTALVDRSRRPKHSPRACAPEVVARVLLVHERYPRWGGRKIHDRLVYEGCTVVPAASTCTEILRRHGALPAHDTEPQGAYRRFERDWPNELWQVDHKGHFATQSGQRCHPLTVTDDHSRFNIVLAAHADQTGQSVQGELTQAFRLYGLPQALLCDNGAPWGCADPTCPFTTLTVWLLRLGVRVLHGRPYHPQTQGKAERFHATLTRELLSQHTWRDLQHCAQRFDSYRHEYNCERPHDELAGMPPITRYRPSVRGFPETLPQIAYAPGFHVHRLRDSGLLTFRAQTWYIGRAFSGLPIGLRACEHVDGHWDVYFAQHKIGHIDLTTPPLGKHTARSIYLHEGGEADRLPCTPSAQPGEGREPSPLP